MAPSLKDFPDRDAGIAFWADLVTHPEKNLTGHVNFEAAGEIKFDPNAKKLSRANAWWLAEASFLSYWHDEAAVEAIYRDKAGLRVRPLSKEETQCHLAYNDRFAIVAFRGTEPGDWRDIFDDARFGLVDSSRGKVHGGFADAFNLVAEELTTALAELAPNRPLWFTGHSLGAALATLAADRFPQTAGVYTFGSPRVGDQIFVGHFNATFASRGFRFVNDHDVVTHVPPEGFGFPLGRYTHVEELRWIDMDGHIGITPPTVPHFLDVVFGSSLGLLHDVQRLLAGKQLTMPAALADHAPILYVLSTWNDLVRNR